MRKIIYGRTPVRISLGGGGTDLKEYYERFGGAVLSTTINRYTYGTLKTRKDGIIKISSGDLDIKRSYRDIDSIRTGDGLDLVKAIIKYFRPETGVEISICSDIPAGSGLGLSGAVTVNLANMFGELLNKKFTKEDLAEIASTIEIDIVKRPIGKQDQYASSFGGFNFIRFSRKRVEVTPIKAGRSLLDKLGKNLMLFFTKRSRNSAVILSRQKEMSGKKASKTIDGLDKIKKMAYEMKDALESGNIDSIGELLHDSWLEKRKLAGGITSAFIDSCYDAAREAGAAGGKITGAGGGGFLLLYCRETRQPAVRNRLKNYGLEEMKFRFDYKGAAII